MNKRPISFVSLILVLGMFLCLLLVQEEWIHLPQEDKVLAVDDKFQDGQTVKVIGTIDRREKSKEQQIIYLTNSKIISHAKEISSIHLILYLETNSNLKIGNTIQVTGNLKRFKNPTNPGAFNERLYYKSLGLDYKMSGKQVKILNSNKNSIKEFLYKMRERGSLIFSKIADEKEAGVLKAMLLGDNLDLDPEIKTLYQKEGISHIIAISGLHISLIGFVVYKLLRKAGAPFGVAGMVSILFLLPYAIMTGFSISTARSLIMFCVMMGGQVLGRTYDILTSLSIALIFLIWQNPYNLLSPGFLLSFGAVLGIGISTDFLSLVEDRPKWIQTMMVSLCIQFMTFPILLYYYFEYPIYSILLNLIVVPIMSLIVLSGTLGCLAGLVSVPAGTFLVGLGGMILRLYEWLCRVFKCLPYSSMTLGRSGIFQIGLYYLLFFLLIRWISKKPNKCKLLLLPVMVLIVSVSIRSGFDVVFIDVGQGDGIFMESDAGTTYLIDGGSASKSQIGKYRILPCIKSLGIGKLDYCIVTHVDEDHISGLKEIMQSGYSIKHLLMPETNMTDEPYKELIAMAKEAGIATTYLKKGDIIKDGDTTITCLHPYYAYQPSSRNSYSTVLHVNYKDFDMLLAGDVEGTGEEEIMNILKEDHSTTYEVLKVAHHGSKNSSKEEFLNVVKPMYSVISCGENNVYGHPHKETLMRLEKIHSKIFITKETGAVLLHTDGKRLSIHGYDP